MTTPMTPAHAPSSASNRASAPGGASLESTRARLRAAGQEHVLKFWPELDEARRGALLAQLASVDLESVPGLVRDYVHTKPAADLRGTIEPAVCYPRDHNRADKPWDRQAYFDRGAELIAAGNVAAFTVAGGQGSRLGFDGPKGCFPGGAVTNRPLFGCVADWILAAQARFCRAGVVIPWYVMTSPGNHEATVAFFRANAFFGLRERDVMFFPQGVMPALELGTGRMLLADRHELALAPDGHGGSIKALAVSGALADMQARGVEQLSYTQIDNPLVRAIDPVFIGLHAFAPDSSGEMSSKMVVKAHAGEKVGVFARVGGKTSVIEYSDMPAELANRTDGAGGLVFNAGSIAIHVISTAFIARLNTSGSGVRMPYHRADKKIACVDLGTGQRLDPAAPNAVKLETFVFDALPLAEASIVMETDRIEEFAPIKNATGPDSVQTCKEIQTLRASRWLEKAGVRIPYKPDGSPDCVLEISPRTAMFCADLKAPGAIRLPAAVGNGASVAL
jgi:UDP-N-acetylglucosamine/UDP-N-acetylgalactosamine diphosphorylase